MYRKYSLKWYYLLFTILLFVVSSCEKSVTDKSEELPALKEIYENHFVVGAALNQNQVANPNSKAMKLVEQQFNSITPENLLKWQNVHPEPDSFNFQPVEQYIQFGETHDMFTVGHTLVWHNQTPDWVFMDQEGNELSRSDLLERMENHISAVAGKYSGKIDGWDVVNEAFEDDGTYRETKWYKIIGEDYIEHAFTYANRADSAAQLYYNDYNLWKPEKREAVINLIEKLQDKEIKIDAVGMQAHLGLEHPSIQEVEASIVAFSELGIDVMITELDINVTRNLIENDIEFEGELPDSLQQKLADRYANLFSLFNKHSDKISRVTFWGVNDGQSWLNYRDDSSRVNYPLLFDRDNEPKPAFYSVVEVVKGDM
jgi:endo-1,4-beta-xylanase